MYNGMVCRITRAEQAHEDSLRPYLPTALRNQVMHNFHSSIYGVHRGAASTYREVSSRFFWPGMQEDVGDFVSTCEACQLGKGGCPTRQGLLHGRHYNNAFSQLCLDLVGPINQESGTNDKYVLMMLDPFTHFVWLEVISTKHAESIVSAFVNRILLEEGAPKVILTDNGSEFKNKHLANLMATLEVEHQFSPRYFPRANQAERSNRFMVELLRTITSAPGAAAKDWQGYIKYIEFAMRRSPIPGTNLTPFEVMRGREPVLAIDLPLAADAPARNLHQEEHTRQLKTYKATAERLVKSATEKVKAKNKDFWNLAHQHCTFQPGDKVRYWSVQHTSHGNAAKLKLRNGVYEVTARHGDRYDLRHVEHPELSLDNIHVSFLARWRSADTPTVVATGEPVADDDDDDDGHGGPGVTLNDEQVTKWTQLKQNQLTCFVMRDEPPCNLRTAEVLEIDQEQKRIKVQYWIDTTPGVYRPAMPIGKRRLKPEWQDSRGQTRLKTSKETATSAAWEPRLDELSFADIEVVMPVVKTQVGGSVVPEHVVKINAWLKRRSQTDGRAAAALRSLSSQQDGSEKGQTQIWRAIAEQFRAANERAASDTMHRADSIGGGIGRHDEMLQEMGKVCALRTLCWLQQQLRSA